jgi:hypothetical protein
MKEKKKISGVETIGKDMGKRPAKKSAPAKKKARRV